MMKKTTLKLRYWEHGITIDVSPRLLKSRINTKGLLLDICERMHFDPKETEVTFPDGSIHSVSSV